jgi:hypothetical protein
MPGWLKILLIVLVVIILGVVAVIAAAGFWFYRNKDALVAKTKAIAEDGRTFGENTDNQGCVDETVSRYKADPGLTSTMSNVIFMRICLDASRETPGFCDTVPKQREFMKTAEWRKEQCQRVGLGRDSYCQNLFTPIQQFCEEKSAR